MFTNCNKHLYIIFVQSIFKVFVAVVELTGFKGVNFPPDKLNVRTGIQNSLYLGFRILLFSVC